MDARSASQFRRCFVRDWYAPQAFLLLEASAVHSNTLTTGLGDVAIRNRIQQSGAGMSAGEGGPGGPYLALAVVGEHSKREGYLALRAYAQPIFKGNQFVPVERASERRLFELLMRFQYLMRARRVAIAIKKPLFDILTDKGFVRPKAIIAFRDYNTGEDDQFAIQLIDDDTPEDYEAHTREQQRIAEIAPVLTRVRDDITIVTDDKDRLLAQIGRNPGDKTSALETLGEKQVDIRRGDGAAREFTPKIPDHLRSGDDTLPPLPNVDRDSLRAVPQIDLPERNIERSR